MNAALAHAVAPGRDCARHQADFEAWLDRVYSICGLSPHPLSLDVALSAFEEGVAASDFAVQLEEAA